MLVFLSVKQFFRDMRSQKLRTLMTLFGIMWGTISVVLLLAFGTGLQEYQLKRFRGLGEQITIIWSGITSKPWNGLPRGRRVLYTEEDVANMKNSIPGIKRISPEFTASNVMLKSHRNNLIARISGVWPEFNEMRNIIPQEGGRFINDHDNKEKRRTIFIGDELAEKLFPGEDAVGQTLQVRGIPFVVVGVMVTKDQNSSYGGRDTRNAYIAATTFHSMWSRRYPSNTVVQAVDDKAMKPVIDGMYRYLAAKYNFDPKDTEALMVWDTSEGFKFFNTFFLAFKLFLVGIGCLTLITGGIGVTNIMNVVLEERTKEIGIKMALGAKRITIMMQFMFETILLTFLGGAIGFAVAMIIVKFFPMLNLTEDLGTPIVHFGESLGAVAILGIIAFLAGFFPARRAARLEPVKALKLF
jgi:putative ABC transport system permease protein